MLDELASDLCEITGYDKISFQPNRFQKAFYLKICFSKKNVGIFSFQVVHKVSMPVSEQSCNTWKQKNKEIEE